MHRSKRPTPTNAPLQRAERFCEAHGLDVPILLAPMAGACPVHLSVAVANAGGMGGAGRAADVPRGHP